jgi:hypothetical protein
MPEHGPDTWRMFGHPQHIETGGRPDRGVCAAVDVHYLRTGGTRAAAVLAADAACAHVLAERTAVVPRVAPYRPGEFYLRELPPLLAVLTDLSELAARCWSPPPGCPQPTQRTWSGGWPAGTGCPTHCAAPTPSPGQARPQPP